ncbi:DUF6093 family protein [Micromonospora sp. NPDC023956]|uniref:DUF6093 family protein n=1 Tax=Micromonospora sp. NPDC023956 TaxID=3155722 RepID=UPI003410FE52
MPVGARVEAVLMDAAAVLARGRAMAETLMVDECVIRRRTGETNDDESGVVTPDYEQVYGGKCRIQQPTATAQEQESGQAALLLVRFELQVPMSVVGVAADDEVQVTASVHDPDLVGRRFVVRGLAHKTHATARRMQVEERTS